MDIPIMVHGLFRTNSTYWFSKFREVKNLTCFYEPLHPRLTELASAQTKPTKSMRHPNLEQPYFSEYPGDVRINSDWALKNYHLESDHEPTLLNYIQRLQPSGSRAVFQFNRANLKMEWFNENFRCIQIYLERDLGSLVRSYYSFRGYQSFYLTEYIATIAANAKSPLFEEIAEYLSIPSMEGCYQEIRDQSKRLKHAKFKDGSYSRQTMIDMVGFFHAVSSAHARKHADLVINQTNLQPRIVEKAIEEVTAVKLNLSDYVHKKPAKEVQSSIDSLLQRAIVKLR